jgi:DNA polymerase-3 subunit gamma/tau
VADTPDDTPYQSLYRRFRPSTFGEVRGQDHVVLALRNAVRDGRVAHAYLFSGPRGTGKTSTARILAKALNCTDLRDGEPCGVCSSCVEITKGVSLDVHELDAASNNGVEAMRDLVSRAALGTPGRQKVYIVDEVHMLSTPASNALLKTLEEPPAHVVFVLATTDPQKVLPTIRSRTQQFEFRLLGPETLGALLDQVRRDAHLEVPDEALALAVRRGRGSARDALSVLDQVAASDGVEDDLPALDEVVEALADRDVSGALMAVSRLTSAGFGPQQLAGDLIDHLRQGFLALVAPDLVAVSGSERQGLMEQAGRLGLAALVRAMEVLGQAQVSMRDAPDPRVNLEVALVRLAHPEADESPEAMLVRIERLEAERGADPGTGQRRAVADAGAGAVAEPEPVETASAESRSEPAAYGSGDGPSPSRRTVGAVRRSAPTASPASSSTPPTGGPTDGGPIDGGPAEPDGPGGDAPVARAPGGQPVAPFPTRDELVQAWGDHVIGRLRPKAKALFQAGRFVGVDGDRAVFGLPNEIHRTRCVEVQGEIETVLSDHFARHVGLVLVVDDGAVGAAGESVAPPETGEHAAAEYEPPPSPRATSSTSSTRSVPAASSGQSSAARAAALAPAPAPGGRPASSSPMVDESADIEDLSVFDESELGEVAEIDNSAEARLLQAFPGAEEIG